MSWRRDVVYEIPVSDQHVLFEEVLGDSYLDHATILFRQELARRLAQRRRSAKLVGRSTRGPGRRRVEP